MLARMLKKSRFMIPNQDVYPAPSIEGCEGCVFEDEHKATKNRRCKHMNFCFAHKRPDKTSVIFKKLTNSDK